MKHPSFRKRAGSGSMPYYVPMNRNRQRTKSESADVSNSHSSSTMGNDSSMDCENINDKGLIMDMDAPLHHVNSNPQFNKIKISQLKKSKSMESILLNSSVPEEKLNAALANSSTLEFPTLLHRIQKLKFNE
jgi:hypothetical protein